MEGKMKRQILFVFFGLLVISTQLVVAQSKPFTGYDKVGWGVSVNTVREVYSIGESIQAVVSEEDENIVTLTQENISDAIIKRQFLFNGDKLYRVWVYYKDINDNTEKSLQDILKNRYGYPTDFDTKMERSSLMFQTVYVNLRSTIYGKFVPDILVELMYLWISMPNGEKDTNNLLGQNSLAVCYTWKKFRDEYQASKLGL
jgi:hypothetical protein